MPESIPQPTADPSRPADGATPSIADSRATTDDEPASGMAVAAPAASDRYALLEKIARGGMGAIYRATDAVLNREVAVKVLQEKYAQDTGAARRFADEARITAQLQHPAIPPVHDLGTLPDGRPFLAMKLIKGQTLDDLLAARPNPSAERGRFVAAFEQVCQAVAYAHAHGVLHRDLKPANVMVGAFGEVQLMDWGLAKVLTSRERERPEADPEATRVTTAVVSQRESDGVHTQAGSVLGTPAYMAPEQAAGAVGKVDQRSDVFGLGAILAVILTGQPPFADASVETARLKAAQGDVAECFARLNSCGAEPELVALCKYCLRPKRSHRPANGGEVARAIAEWRTAADERARRAELERVQVEAEQAAVEGRALERRKRRRLVLGAAAALVLAALGGLTAVLVVQRRSNEDLAAKNRELAAEQAKVQARFELAQKAIATFHTGVSEDMLLTNRQFKELRTRLLKEAAGFYGDLEKLLEGQTDGRSRRLLAEGYSQLGQLTEKIGSKPAALAIYRKALVLRRELAAAADADVEMHLDVARSLGVVGNLLAATGDAAGAMAAYEEQGAIAADLEAKSPTDAVRAMRAWSHRNVGILLADTGKRTEALAAYQKATALLEKLEEDSPAKPDFQRDLAESHNRIGIVMFQMNKPAEALTAYEKARVIRQKLADANPAVTQFQRDLAVSHLNIGIVLKQTGKPVEALAAYEKARAIRQEVADANPAVTDYQSNLAASYYHIGNLLTQTGKPAEALPAHEKALAIWQKLAEDNPTVTAFQNYLANCCLSIGWARSQTNKPAQALAAYDQALTILQKLAKANPAVPLFQTYLTHCYLERGWHLARMGRFADALASLDTGRDLVRRQLKANPKDAANQRRLAESYAFRGWALGKTGRLTEAAAELREALVRWDESKARDSDTLLERARALAVLAGMGTDAKSGVRADEAADFAAKAVDALRDAVGAGWDRAEQVREPDFDPIRKREDFRKLVKELEAKADPAGRNSPDKAPQANKK